MRQDDCEEHKKNLPKSIRQKAQSFLMMLIGTRLFQSLTELFLFIYNFFFLIVNGTFFNYSLRENENSSSNSKQFIYDAAETTAATDKRDYN
jgi:hypothetical protein